MSIRKIRKAGQCKVFMSCTKYSNGVYMYTKLYGSQRFKFTKSRNDKWLNHLLDCIKRKKSPHHKF